MLTLYLHILANCINILMPYYYQVFGLNCLSEFEIPAFLRVSSLSMDHIDFEVKIGKVERKFDQPAQVLDDHSQMNGQEFYLKVPEVAKYFVKDGNAVTIEPLTEDMRDVLLYFQSNGLAAILFQRKKFPFHVSGVVDHDGGVWLFSADSGTGKSTTALKLKELGYPVFTDDTALIYVENGKCYARASYPMIKAWPKTMENQNAFCKTTSFPILKDWEKVGIYFHEGFINQPKEVKGIIFLKSEGDEIHIQSIPAIQGMIQLIPNVYRGEWVTALNQNELQFIIASEIAKVVPFYEATRPKDKPSFNDFATAIEEKIMNSSNNKIAKAQ